MSLAPHDIRDRLAAHLAGALPEWHESPYPLELMPYDARSDQHRSFALALPSTVPVRGDRQSGRGGVAAGTQAATVVQVGWSWWVRSTDAVADYSEALAAELVLLSALGKTMKDPSLSFALLRLSRRVVNGDGGALFLGVVELEVYHRLPLVV